MTTRRVNILGVGVSATNLTMAVAEIVQQPSGGRPLLVSTCTAHTLVECRRDASLRRKLNQMDLATPDGMPLVWLARSAGYAEVSRVYGPDLMLAVCQAGLAQGFRHLFYGGAPGVPERLAAQLKGRFPGLVVAGAISPPYHLLSPREDNEMLARINVLAPDIVWVGLGTPKQDHWVADHRDLIRTRALIGVGAAFDFHSGRVRQAPRWIQRSGFEWAFRLAQEPRRLWRRYVIDNALFLAHVALQRTGLRKYPID